MIQKKITENETNSNLNDPNCIKYDINNKKTIQNIMIKKEIN